jgi:Chitin binding Peritrophin-A domain
VTISLTVIVLALIAFASAPALAQEVDCTEEFFRVGRRDTGCQDFFVCMVGGRVDFSCDDGEIFDGNYSF